MGKDYYKILGVNPNSSSDEIKSAFRKLAKQYHPDINKSPDAESKFKEANEAFQVLGDPQKKANYDQFGTDQPGFQGGGGGFNFNDIFGDDIFDMFSNFMGGGRRQSRKERGRDVEFPVDISLEDAFNGGELNLKIPMQVSCKSCNGSGGDLISCSTCKGAGQVRMASRTPFGNFINVQSCPSCKGRGKIVSKNCSSCKGKGFSNDIKKVNVKIPKGVNSGNYVRLDSEGEHGLGGNGDLFIVFKIKDHDVFDRHGNDLFCKTIINLGTAILGGDVKVPTINGSATLKIPKGTQSSTVFRMKGLGMPLINGFGSGDQVVKVEVQIPKRISKEQERLIKAFESGSTKTVKGFFERMREKIN